MPDAPDNKCSCPKCAKRPEPPKCPDCGQQLDVLLFMDAQPDGYVCKPCGRLYGLDTLEPGPRVI